MGDQVIIRRDLEDMIRNVVSYCLGVDPDAPESQSRIRISWPVDSASGSQPGWKKEDNVCFIRLAEDATDQYGSLWDISHRYNEDDTQTEIVKYTRVHTVHLIFYGPKGYDDSETVRIGMFREEARRMLRTAGVYAVPGVKRPIRIPELNDGEWWERCDLTFKIYENVTREYNEEFIEEAPITTLPPEP